MKIARHLHLLHEGVRRAQHAKWSYSPVACIALKNMELVSNVSNVRWATAHGLAPGSLCLPGRLQGMVP